MDSKPSNPNENPKSRVTEYTKSEVLTNESATQEEDDTKKSDHSIKSSFKFYDSAHKIIHESDKNTLMPLNNSLTKVPSLSGMQCANQTERSPSQKRSQLDQVCLVPYASDFEKSGTFKRANLNNPEQNTEGKQVIRKCNLCQPPVMCRCGCLKNDHTENEQSIREFNSVTSLICKLINCEGEPVKVNDQVINDKLILSCSPKRSYKSNFSEFERNRLLENENLCNNNVSADNRQEIKKTYFIQPKSGTKTYNKKYYSPNETDNYIKPIDDSKSVSSLICKVINCDGEPVKINDQVTKDKLILSCYPRGYKDRSLFKQYSTVNHERMMNYKSTIQQDNADLLPSYKQTDVDHKTKAIEKTSTYDQKISDIGKYQDMPTKQKEFEKWYREIKCKENRRKLERFSWVLFIVSILLALVGMMIFITTLVHLLLNGYINVVIAQRSFAPWIWITYIISFMIILIAICGIFSSVFRTTGIICLFRVMAGVLAIIILLFLLIFWLKFSSLKSIRYKSMIVTMSMYRCNSWIHKAWDSLQEKFQCCGIDSREDWKFIPPSCCTADAKSQKLACINHFIHKNHAFKRGCQSKLEDYFNNRVLLLTMLLVLAIILLLFGILAACRLLKLHKSVISCKEIHNVSS